MKKIFYFTTNSNWTAMVKNGNVALVREEIEKVGLVTNEYYKNAITAANVANYILDELSQNSHEDFAPVFKAFEQKFVEVKDYESLQMISKYLGTVESSAEATRLRTYFENAKLTAENIFAEFYRGVEETCGERKGLFFSVKEPFPIRFIDGQLLFTADNGIEYRVFHVNYAEFGRRG